MKRVVVGLGVGALALASTVTGGLVVAGTAASSGPASAALGEIPPGLLTVYEQAADACGGLPWSVLAAVGWVESRHGAGHVDPATGQVDPPIYGPALDGRNGRALVAHPTSADGFAHALGPMQILPSTWATY